MIDVLLAPFARANFINSESSTSNRADLVSLNKPAEASQPRQTDGMIQCEKPPGPAVGSQPSFTENTIINTIASQNDGTDCPRIANPLPK